MVEAHWRTPPVMAEVAPSMEALVAVAQEAQVVMKEGVTATLQDILLILQLGTTTTTTTGAMVPATPLRATLLTGARSAKYEGRMGTF